MQSISCEMPGWMNQKLKLIFPGKKKYINNLTQADDSTVMAKNEEKLKSLLRSVKEESEKLT